MRPRTFPLATAGLVAANIAAFGLELAGDGQALCETHGLVPNRLVASGDVGPALTAMFLHDPAHYSHIAGNMVFLAVFGAIVERAIGHLRFAALYLAAGVAGAAMHVLVDPTSTVPMVGASGAAFGVLAVGAALRPRLLPFVAAYVGINLWYVLTGTGGTVSAGAHIGGFVAGVLVAALGSKFSLQNGRPREPHALGDGL
jgi:membrane associated rhomboid family serine protease